MDNNFEKVKTTVLSQMDFYYSEYNLIRDRFLRNIINQNDGWISFDILMKFNRLKQLVNYNKELLVKVLTSIASESDMYEINVSENKFRRLVNKPLQPLSEQRIHDLKLRTVHVSGFPLTATFDDIMLWSHTYGTVESLDLRQNDRNEFKGCVFIGFTDKSMADKVLNQSVLMFCDRVLMKETKLRYFERKDGFVQRF